MVTDLRFNAVLKSYIALYYGGDWEGDVADHILKNAQYDHSLQVRQATLDAFIESVNLSHRLQEERAQHFVRFGVARRLEMIWYAYSDLIFTAGPKREQPLTMDEGRQLTADLNLIYVNIRGVLDNLCWALLHESAPDKLKTLRESNIELFRSCIVKDVRFAGLHEVLGAHAAWNIDLKGRRDPSAHRIPLTIPPQFVTGGEARAYRQLEQDYQQAIAARNYEDADRVMEDQGSVGRFFAYFVHDPNEGLIPIYPTTPDDVGHTIELFRAVEAFIK